VKTFLKQPGGAEQYPNLEITWERGHDPELEARNCTGSPPSQDLNTEVIRMDLSPFTTEELHLLVQCLGLIPLGSQSRDAALQIPQLPSIYPERVRECKRLREMGAAGSWWHWLGSLTLKLLALGVVILLCFLLWKFCLSGGAGAMRGSKRQFPWHGKVKEEDADDEIGLAEL